MNRERQAAISAFRRKTEFSFVALAKIIFPVSSAMVSISTLPDILFCLATAGNSGFIKLTAQPCQQNGKRGLSDGKIKDL
ncbi:MAG TPA: hypothetical protein VF721_06280 [Pyrinomonadaceae bacterium]